MQEWLWRVKAMLGRNRLAAEKEEELRLHLEMETEAGIKQGLSVDEARRRARLRVGTVSEAVESTREQWGFPWLDGTAADLRHALRALTRNHTFGTVAVLVLAASVAINTLVFCMLEGVVLRPLPYRSPERLVRLYDASAERPKFPMSIGHYLDYRASASSIESIALYTGRDMELTGIAKGSRELTGVAITSGYFQVLGRTPHLGRTFTDDDLRRGVRHVIISHRLWREHFQSDAAVAGKVIRLNREPWTIIGVAPPGFQHVGGDYRSPLQGETVDIWLPLALDGSEQGIRASHYCNAIARIRDGMTQTQVRQELERLAGNYAQRYPNFGQWSIGIQPLLSEVTGRSRDVVWLLVAAGALLLLVAGANIAGLCIARSVARRKELSLRHALGANRWQLTRVGLAENLLIGVAGAVLGLLIAAVGLPVLRQLLPPDFPRAHEIALTGMGALFATAVAIATVLLAGLLPAGGDTSMQSQRTTSGRDSRKLRRVLVAGEVAVAGLLCAGALFLLRSYQEIGDRDHGFNAASVLTFRLRLVTPGGDNAKPYELARLYDDLRREIAEVPGVTAVGATTNLPWSGYDENTGFAIVGRPVNKDDSPGGRYQAATPGYFEAAGMRLVAGRLFDPLRDASTQPLNVIVNDELVRRYFPDGKAVGARLALWGKERQIVGVVAGIRDYPADLETQPAFWFPLAQVEFPAIFVAVRSNSQVDPASLTASVSAAVHKVDPELPVG
ncbi:MAG: ABC transporter permease, partial [Bryobacteraceae bacterium]|nr:ABC transporter permease [Bryobacteraceae bacterium]